MAVSDPRRREMLDLLAKGPMSAGEIVSHFADLTQPGVSSHLRVLRDAQLVEVTPDKRVVWVLEDWTDFGPATAVQILDDPGIPERPSDSQH